MEKFRSEKRFKEKVQFQIRFLVYVKFNSPKMLTCVILVTKALLYFKCNSRIPNLLIIRLFYLPLSSLHSLKRLLCSFELWRAMSAKFQNTYSWEQGEPATQCYPLVTNSFRKGMNSKSGLRPPKPYEDYRIRILGIPGEPCYAILSFGRVLLRRAKVEPVGIEPTSRQGYNMFSTCLVFAQLSGIGL